MTRRMGDFLIIELSQRRLTTLTWSYAIIANKKSTTMDPICQNTTKGRVQTRHQNSACLQRIDSFTKKTNVLLSVSAHSAQRDQQPGPWARTRNILVVDPDIDWKVKLKNVRLLLMWVLQLKKKLRTLALCKSSPNRLTLTQGDKLTPVIVNAATRERNVAAVQSDSRLEEILVTHHKSSG
ncbi:hypothetical protein B566_EDAN007562 [Ephemera danica]|nr:hypothetical protein B566_EDAN007562 [Ephemera danica]